MAMKQRNAERKGSIRFDSEEYPHITRSEFEKVKELFRRYDSNNSGNIKKSELLDLMKDLGNYMHEAIKKRISDELEKQGVRYIDLGVALQIINDVKEWEDEDEDLNDDYVNAFVAMGGNPDRSGIVRKDTIINLIKNEFELTFDIEELFEKSNISNNEDLDFQAFCSLFEGNPDDEKSISRANSLLSLMSDRGKKKNSGGDAFTVRYRDFEKFLIKEKEKGKWFLS